MTESAFWNNDWAETQRKYWESWTEMSRKAMGMDVPPKSPWENAMEHWWKAVSPMTPSPAQGFMEKMLDQGKIFFQMAEEYGRNFQNLKTDADWTAGLNKTIKDLQDAFSGSLLDGDESLHKIMAFWELPLDNWQRMVSSLSISPGDMLKNMPHGGMQASLDQFLSAPGLGYTREEQGQQQQMIRLMLDYQKSLQAYAQFFSNLGMLTVDRFKEKVEAVGEAGNVIDSARALYDLWIGASEEVYGEQVMTAEYAKLHGELVNGLMAVKKQYGTMVDEFLGMMNMPTRGEMKTLQDRMQETRRENKALRAELDDLKERLDGMATAKVSAPVRGESSAPAPKRKVAAKKKVAAQPRAATKKKVAATKQ